MKHALVLAASLLGCSQPPTEVLGVSVSPSFALATPNVTMEADPAPPFTYWAPEGATIRNHPHAPGIWHAFVEGRNVATYFGDQCRASEFQRFVGEPLQSFPQPPEGVEVRTSCETCAVNGDLRANRINVVFDEASQKISKVACY